MMKTLSALLLSLVYLINRSYAACIFPSVFSQSLWVDNVKGDVNFTTWEMKGWKFSVGADLVDDWEILDNTMFESDGYLALRSHDTFAVAGTTYHSFACLKFSKISEDVYKYHSLHDKEPLAGNERVLLHESDALTKFDQVCNTSYSIVDDDTNFNLLIKKGADPKTTCPNPILGRFDYTLTYANGTTGCATDEGSWDGCKVNTIIELNYTACSAEAAYSAEGKLSCIVSTSYNDAEEVQIFVYNQDDTVDNVNTFRISCIRSTKDGKEMSIAPGYCRQGQTPYAFPQEGGNDIGQKLTTTELSNCRIYPTPPDDGDKLSTGVIVGIAVGGAVALILIIALIIFICCVCKRRAHLSSTIRTASPIFRGIRPRMYTEDLL